MSGIPSRTETIGMPDEGAMDAHVAIPAAGSGPGVLVLMEIFGVGAYIRGACDRLAEQGYVSMAPDLYRRIRPGARFGPGEEGLREAGAAVAELDMDGAIEDASVALEALRGLPEVNGRTGALGFCLGGSLAFGVAVNADPGTLVAYYGSHIPETPTGSRARRCFTSAPRTRTSRCHRPSASRSSPRRVPTGRSTSRSGAATRSTIGRTRCSTSPSRPLAPGS